MKYLQMTFVMILVIFLVSPLLADQSPLSKLIPKEMETRGWIMEDEAFVAGDEEMLSMIINGAAPRYMELGTQKALFANYEKASVFLMLELFKTDSKKSANKLYKEFLSANAVSLDNLGEKARSTSELGGTSMIEFSQGNYYVRLSITKKTDEAKKTVLACARIISGHIDKLAVN
ncbi:MAG: hypothetical protein GY729_07945 [Desulfobacteraceae bacterium]|nr:hypothetical protein [Desulfobacteraceae bacterium]